MSTSPQIDFRFRIMNPNPNSPSPEHQPPKPRRRRQPRKRVAPFKLPSLTGLMAANLLRGLQADLAAEGIKVAAPGPQGTSDPSTSPEP